LYINNEELILIIPLSFNRESKALKLKKENNFQEKLFFRKAYIINFIY